MKAIFVDANPTLADVAERLHRAVDSVHLGCQIFWHAGALRLVGRVQRVTKRRPARIEHACGILRLIVLRQPAQHVQHPVERPRPVGSPCALRKSGIA